MLSQWFVSWFVMLRQWLKILVFYDEPVVVDHGVFVEPVVVMHGVLW
jgi:hypothetical protein